MCLLILTCIWEELKIIHDSRSHSPRVTHDPPFGTLFHVCFFSYFLLFADVCGAVVILRADI